MNSSAAQDSRLAQARDAVRFCLRRRNLRRTSRIALVVGVILTAINQGAVIASGNVTVATWVRCALNFVVPFIVSNAGLLSGRERRAAAVDTQDAWLGVDHHDAAASKPSEPAYHGRGSKERRAPSGDAASERPGGKPGGGERGI